MSLAVAFGTAHLYATVDGTTSEHLLDLAVGAGFARLDTAPSYGHGRTEGEVGRRHPAAVTTKVGLEPAPPAAKSRRVASALLGPLRTPVRQLRARGRAPDAHAPTGRFDPVAVQASVERSLQRLGRIDRLLLHEVSPADLDPPLLQTLARFVERGEVGELGVATARSLTPAALRRGDGLLTVAQLSVAPSAGPLPRPAARTVVGHGLLGQAGADLARTRRVLARDSRLAAAWREATAGTPWADDLPRALLQRVHRLPLDEVVVATGRPAAVPGLAALATPDAVPAQAWETLDLLVAAVTAAAAGRRGRSPRRG